VFHFSTDLSRQAVALILTTPWAGDAILANRQSVGEVSEIVDAVLYLEEHQSFANTGDAR
jgi:hypothetical protein